MFTVLCKKACAETSCCRPLLTVGMSKAETVEFVFSAEWEGLTKTAVFTDGTVTVDVLQPRWQGNTVTIPAEVLTTAGRYVRVGVYGSNADGVALPTIWADLGKVRPGAEPSGDASTDPALPVWAQLQALIGDLDDLTTKAKDNLVAAINEAAKTGSGGSGSIDLRVADGYIQYSNDGGTTWENLIAVADLKGDDGAPGTPGTDGKDGTNGQDGYSPSASVSETDTGATITITDKTGTTTAEIKNGKDGKDGVPGKDGTDGKDGAPGAKGDPGATPNLQIGTVETLPAGSEATASVSGTAENPLLNLGIPKGADGSGGSSAITTATETDIAGLLMGEGGKVRKAIPDVDYRATKELPTPENDEYNGSYLRWYQGSGWIADLTDIVICEIAENAGQYYCSSPPSAIQAFVTASRTVIAQLHGEPYLLTSLSAQAAVFTRVAGTTVTTVTVSSDYTAALTTTELQPAGGSGGTDLSLGVTGATVGQIAKITAVDADGKPTAWSPVDMPSGGGGAYTVLYDQTLDEAAAVSVQMTESAAKCNEYIAFLSVPKGDTAVSYTRFTTFAGAIDVVNNISVVSTSYGSIHNYSAKKIEGIGMSVEVYVANTANASPGFADAPRTNWVKATDKLISANESALYASVVELPAGSHILIAGR